MQSAAVSVDKNGNTETPNGKDDVEVLIPCNNPDCLNSKVTQFATMALCANTLDPVGNGMCINGQNSLASISAFLIALPLSGPPLFLNFFSFPQLSLFRPLSKVASDLKSQADFASITLILPLTTAKHLYHT